MATNKHYFIEQTKSGDYATRARGAERASALSPTQREAIERAKSFNPSGRPDVERVRETAYGTRDKWRKA
jgi:Uncharacterized protein conserved in bacteria (DUF2188)